MATVMVFGLAGLCAWYIAKVLFTGMAPSRYGPDMDLRDQPVSRCIQILVYGALMLFALWAGIAMLNKP